MKALALINTKLMPADIAEYMKPVMIANNKVQCGLIDVPQPRFNSEDEANKDYVLVRVNAFSCNYRDKAIILKSALKMKLNHFCITSTGEKIDNKRNRIRQQMERVL